MALLLQQLRPEFDGHVDDRNRFKEVRYSHHQAQKDHFWDVVNVWHEVRHSRDPRKCAAYWEHCRLVGEFSPRIERVRHPHIYTILARNYDVAKRLAIKVKFYNNAGHEGEAWLASKGRRCVEQINSKVDRFFGVPDKVIRSTP